MTQPVATGSRSEPGSRRAASRREVLARVAANFRDIDGSALEAIRRSLEDNFFGAGMQGSKAGSAANIATDEGRTDLENHLLVRLRNDRQTVIPWLSSIRPLRGASVLEIGCGTGSSTVALAEQGAMVTALDVDERGINVAKDRCKAFGLYADVRIGNGTEAHVLFAGRRFDLVIFFATLEHMTHDERMSAMKSTWDMLGRGGLWCVIETPNRLWYFDGHTSQLPFYFWLPDDLAFKYTRYSPRESFNALHKEDMETSGLEFLRRGRGVSFHEFDLTLGRVEDLKVVSSLRGFLRSRNPLKRFQARWSIDGRYERLLKSIGPRIHEGFYHPNLDLIIEKS